MTDGDTTTANTLGNETWQWYRSSSKTSRGTAIEEDANAAEYTVVGDDVGNYLRVEVSYNVGGGPQESAYLVSDYRVQAKRATNSEPEFDPATVTRKVNEGEEGMAVGAPVRATDDDGDVLNYRLTGDDSNRFEIDQKTGQITTSEDLDYEATSGDNQCSTANECEVMVTATDSTGAASTPAATVSITLENVDEKPEFTGGLEMVSVAENMTQVSDTAYAATDEDGGLVGLALMGDDGDLFRLSDDPAGELHFRMAPDFENPMDANTDNVYEVTVRALDGTMHKDRMVTITVTAVDESPEIMKGGLSISGSSSMYFSEGETDADATFTARGPMKDMAMWTLEGADRMYFRVGTTRGAMTKLMFSSAPDYEMPRRRAMSDTNTNTYMVTLKANDGTYMDTHDVMVMVTNMKEMGTVTLMPMTPVVGTAVTATLTDPDMEMEDSVTWQWSKSMTMDGTFENIGDATMATYTPMAADDGYYLRATATYTDGYGADTAMETTTAAVTAVTAGDPLVIRYDTNPANGMIDKAEVITAINEYLDAGADAPSKADVIRLINLYLDG